MLKENTKIILPVSVTVKTTDIYQRSVNQKVVSHACGVQDLVKIVKANRRLRIDNLIFLPLPHDIRFSSLIAFFVEKTVFFYDLIRLICRNIYNLQNSKQKKVYIENEQILWYIR